MSHKEHASSKRGKAARANARNKARHGEILRKAAAAKAAGQIRRALRIELETAEYQLHVPHESPNGEWG